MIGAFVVLALGLPVQPSPISVAKQVAVISDPLNGVVAPKSIPGAVVDYTITITNSSGVVLDSGAVVISDAVPANAKLYVKDLGLAGSGPIAFSAGLSGLAYSFGGLGSTTDDVAFSKDGGLTYGYTPVADADGYDALVSNVRVKPRNATPILGVFSLRFRSVVK